MKLDELEARVDNTLFAQVGKPRTEHPYFRGEHAHLLIAAVRQLGKGRRYKYGRLDGGTWVPYDPDVLELLETEDA